jgi:NADPH2:quinone reductase
VVEVELGGNMPVSSRVIKANGVIAAYASMAVPEVPLPFYPLLRTGPTIEIVACFTVPEAAKMQGVRDIGEWLAANKLRHHIGATFSLNDIVSAHEAVESGSVMGGVVLEIAAG